MGTTLYRSAPQRLVAWGSIGSFTKVDCRSDRFTQGYFPPTAAEGFFKAIHWHPEAYIHKGEKNELGVEIQSIWLLSPIRTMRMRLNEIDELPRAGRVCLIKPRQTSVVVLRDLKYLIQGVYIARSQARADKGAKIFARRLSKGQSFRQPCFGRRRYPAYFREAQPDDVPIDVDLDLGKLPWRIEYSGEHAEKHLHCFDAVVRRGVLAVPSWFDHVERAGLEVQL